MGFAEGFMQGLMLKGMKQKQGGTVDANPDFNIANSVKMQPSVQDQTTAALMPNMNFNPAMNMNNNNSNALTYQKPSGNMDNLKMLQMMQKFVQRGR